MWPTGLLFSSLLFKCKYFKIYVYILKYACLCNKVFGIKNTYFIVTTLRQRRFIFEDINLGIRMTYMYIYTTNESDTIACLDLQSFVHFYPQYKAAMTILSTKRKRLVFYFYLVLIYVPFSDTQTDFQNSSGLYVPN